ncbi:AAA family ATPase [Candidatus Poribacteria bacterium]|nr:AAA family ATPase [Candidatus Poribacteria bacterium]MYK21199.1 AAA family ATPase [Candidatus Poribacteria bacterium]
MQKEKSFTPITVGIMGGSASGKTTFAKALAEALSEFSPIVLNQDAYFRDWSEYSEVERERVITANHPDAVLWDALITDIKKLRARDAIDVPIPGTRGAQRGDEQTSVQPSDVVIVEGHLIYWSEDLRDLMDIKLFLDVDAHERVLRRMLRDVAQRGGDLEWAINWYRRDVLPNFPVYTEPCKQYADLVIPFQNENPVALHTLVAGIRARIQENKTSS